VTRLLVLGAAAAVIVSGCAPKTAPMTPTAPRYPDFLQPIAPPSTPPAVRADLDVAWAQLQGGNPGAADRTYAQVLKRAPGTAAALAGQGYAALAGDQARRAADRFDAALALAPAMTAALVGRGEAMLRLDRLADALVSFEEAQRAEPDLGLAPRIEMLRFRVVQETLARARALAKEARWDQARAAYEDVLRASPDSAVIYRELAGVERRAGLSAEADAHLGRAVELDPGDRATHVLLGETREEAGDYDGAIASYEAAMAIEPSPDLEARLTRARERADLAQLPEEFQTLSARPQATRADLAAAIGIRVPGLLARAPARATPVVTDLRATWARPWILATIRAGIIDAYPNHTFQPGAPVRRADLAAAAARTLGLLASQGDRRARDWQAAAPVFTDLPRSHPEYAAAAQAVGAGVLTAIDGAFEPARLITGQELLDAVSRLQRLAGPLAGRDRRTREP
jgi:tetratricopeptide (TPR) repeat protein